MGCTSAKQVSAVPNDEEGRGKAYSNGDLYAGKYTHPSIKTSRLPFSLLTVQVRAITPSVLPIYRLLYDFEASGRKFTSLFANHYCQH